MAIQSTVIDKQSPMPLWAQVLGDLRLRIERGEFRSRFPTDAELTAEYGVSRHTVREAARRLVAEGVIDRSRGQGTFVRPRVIEQPIGSLYSLFRSVEAHGYTQRSIVRYLEERTDTDAAKILGRSPDEPLVYLERLRFADDEPVMLDCSWLPAVIALPLLDVDFEHTALYRELSDRCGVHPDSGWERLAPEIPNREQRDLLALRANVPALAIERLAYQQGAPVEWRHGLVRADRFSYVSRWTSQESGAGFEPRTPLDPPGPAESAGPAGS
jgi:GntR family transcriptional regulator